LVVIVVIGMALAVVWYLRRSPHDPPAELVTAARASAGPAPAKAEASPANPAASFARPPAHATRISPDIRQQIADRIAAARAAHAAHASASPAAGPSSPLRGSAPDHRSLPREQLEALKTPIHDALLETAPFLRECYKKAGRPDGARIQVQGKLVLTGDSDIGTLVDADRLTDEHDQPLPAALDDCLRGAMQTIELPPLREGDTVHVTYKLVDDE
jgi:hypothetical protein